MNPEDQDVESLLRGAAPRPEPPDAVRARVLAATEQAWKRKKRQRWYVPGALAAGLVLAAAVSLLIGGQPAAISVQVAATGGVWMGDHHVERGGELLSLSPGANVSADTTTRLLVEHVDLRLHADTRLRWLDPARIELVTGSVYVDTGGAGRLHVVTPMGVIRDIGTRFMVTVDGDQLEVAMRDGSTSVSTDGGTYAATTRAEEGDVLRIGLSQVSLRAEPLSADRWQWIQSVHPGYRERDLLPLLEAIAGDLGCRLEFASPAVKASALQARVHGDLDDLGPEEALGVVLGSTGLVREPAPATVLRVGFPPPSQ